MPSTKMAYQNLARSGTLKTIKDKLLAVLSDCTLCPRTCHVNRLKEERGFCRTGRLAKVSSFFLHFGEEQELVGGGGSGTIFFSYCNLGCLYCQNYAISHIGAGRQVDAQELAQMMLDLQKDGAENINFVSPTHVIAQIAEALLIAAEGGLRLPLVYNCGGYEKTQTLKLLEGIFDIYMPDIKYGDNFVANKFSGAPDYWNVAQSAASEMHRQVGGLDTQNGIAKKGLLVRHLVLPNRLAGSFTVLDFIKSLSLDTHVNIMDQYYPCYHGHNFPELARRINEEEYKEVIAYAKKIGLYRGF